MEEHCSYPDLTAVGAWIALPRRSAACLLLTRLKLYSLRTPKVSPCRSAACLLLTNTNTEKKKHWWLKVSVPLCGVSASDTKKKRKWIKKKIVSVPLCGVSASDAVATVHQ